MRVTCLVYSWWDHSEIIFAKTHGYITQNMGFTINLQNQIRMLKAENKTYIRILFFLLFNKEMETRDICKMSSEALC